MTKFQHSSFKVSPVAAAIAMTVATSFCANVAIAGSGYGSGIQINGSPVALPTFSANSPAGPSPALAAGVKTVNPITGLPQVINSGKALRKFVDTLPGIPGLTPATLGGVAFGANNLGQYIPLAKAEKWVDLNGVTTSDDYYEIAAVEFTEKMHSDLAKATHLRGYVQLMTPGLLAKGLTAKSFTTAGGKVLSVVDTPHHLGPFIQSAKGTAVRVKFTNYLPAGAELFLPVDTTITGAGMGPDGVTPYTQNRAGIHLVGGEAPWISAGSPNQWVAPADETNAYSKGLGKGASSQNVPDMADPGPGAATLYFPNDLSARFSFFQDRTSGLTRLNAYAGLQAGYMVSDSEEAKLIASGTIPAEQIPLIIEDKTFVPRDILQQDSKWDTAHWGQEGDLWFPHVYETNQSQGSATGANPVGRWDFGPLFWPIFPSKDPLPSGAYGDASAVPEAYMDTPLINGTAYPKLTVDPKAYRLRILNASNDRYINLSLYKADGSVAAPQLDLSGNPIVDATGNPVVMSNTEVKMVPAVGDAAGNPVNWDAVHGVQLPLPKYPALATNIVAEPSGPTRAWPVDSRPGGAPDPTMAGPDFIAIGNDGGLLPHAVDIPAQPVTYESNRRSVTVGNIYGYGMLLGPAERADAIVDFSAYAGQTLILYNDAPAPAPFNDVRNDYYTGGPDQTGAGGAYATKPGYGPNTRTMMQITVNAAPTGGAKAFDPTALVTALPAAYGASQPTPIVPAVAYNAAFGTNDTDIYGHVATGSAAQPTLDFATSVNGVINLTGLTLVTSGGTVGNPSAGSGTSYDPLNPPIVVFNNVVNGVNCLSTGGMTASALAVVDPVTFQVTKITGFSGGRGYTCAPIVTFENPVGTNGVGAQVTVQSTNKTSIPALTKAEQELFDNRGRYNSTGGVELPMTTGVVQTTVPLNYIDSATEVLKDGEVQIWKLVDNGFWSNSIHFSMADVQLINRVGWDGTVKAPANNELGWRDTLRLNPLEDVLVAIRAKRPSIPFGLPQSKRLQDPSKPVGVGNSPAGSGPQYASGLGFTTATGVTPLPAVTNVMANYDNEFVWGSAILGHAENDLTRPVVFQPTVAKPDAPGNLVDALSNGILTWTDPTPVGQLASVRPVKVATIGNPKNEIGFKLMQAPVSALGVVGSFTQFTTVPANVTHWTIPSTSANYAYAVVAFNTAGDSSQSNTYMPPMPVVVADPTAVTATVNTAGTVATLRWTDNANNETTYWVEVSVDGGTFGAPTLVNSTLFQKTSTNRNVTLTPVTTVPGSVYVFRVTAVNVTGTVTSKSNPVSVTLDLSAPAAPSAPVLVAGTQTATRIPLSWATVSGAISYVVQVTSNGGTAVAQAPLTASNTNVTIVAGNNYTMQVLAQATRYGLTVPSALSNTVTVTTPPAASTLTVTRGAAGSKAITVAWTNVSGNITGWTLKRTNGTTNVTSTITPTVTHTGNNFTFTDTGLTVGVSYTYQVTATSLAGSVSSSATATAR